LGADLELSLVHELVAFANIAMSRPRWTIHGLDQWLPT
jgi:hypothetical protein